MSRRDEARRSTTSSLRARSLAELGVVVAGSAGLLAVAISIRLSDVWDRWLDVPTHRHAEDVLFAFPFVMVLLLGYGWRRYREAQVQAIALIAAERDAARRSEEFRSLFAQHPHAVVAVDPQRRYRLLNPAAEALGGYTEAEMVSREFPALKLRERDLVIAAFERAMSREPQRLETVLTGRDGREHDVDVTMVPIVAAEEAVGVYVVAEDITEDKQVRRELAQALRDAQQASEAKSLLVANVSHELRTPLSGVIGSLELLEDSTLDPDQSRLVDIATRNGHSLLRLVDDLLDLTRIEVGQLALDQVPFDLCAMLEQTLSNLTPAARAKDLDLRLEIERPRTLVQGDPLRLGQVLTNLLDNAVKFTDHGEVGLGLSWSDTGTTTPATTVTATFRVWDTGIGIPQDRHEDVFDRFVQIDPSSTRRHGGVGLGLAISRRLVEMMGGTLTLASRPGEGSTFTATVPLTTPAHAAEESDPHDEDSTGDLAQRGRFTATPPDRRSGA